MRVDDIDDEMAERSYSIYQRGSNSEAQLALLLCPTCTKAIPEITFKLDGRECLAVVYCQCSDQSLERPIEELIQKIKGINPRQEKVICLEHQRKTEKYCLDCMQWNCISCIEKHQKKFPDHRSQEFELKLICDIHKKTFIKHCTTCRMSLCSDCLGKHQNHRIITIIKANDSSFQQEYKNIKNYFTHYQQLKSVFISKIDNLIDEAKIKVLNLQKLKNDVEEAFFSNNQVNLALQDFCSLLMATSLSILDYPCYAISKQFQTLQFNTPSLSMDVDNLEEMSLKLKTYYRTQFLLKQIKVDEGKLQNQEDFSSKKIECFATLTEYNNIVSSLVQLKNGHLASGVHKEIKLWNNETYKCYANLVDHTDTVECLLPYGDDLISGSYDFSIKIWEVEAKRVKATLTGHSNYVTSVILIKDGQLASSSDDRSIKFWNLKTLTCSGTLTGHTAIIFSLVLLDDGQIASGSGDQTIKLWNPKNVFNKVNETLTGHNGIVFCVIQLANKMLASGSYDKTIKLWKIKPPKCEATLNGHTDFVRSICQLSDGRIMSGAADSTINFWDSNAPYSCLLTLSSHRDVIRCLIQLENGLIASGSWDMTIKLWTY